MEAFKREIAYSVYKVIAQMAVQFPTKPEREIGDLLLSRFIEKNDGTLTLGEFAVIVGSQVEIVELERDLAAQSVSG